MVRKEDKLELKNYLFKKQQELLNELSLDDSSTLEKLKIINDIINICTKRIAVKYFIF